MAAASAWYLQARRAQSVSATVGARPNARVSRARARAQAARILVGLHKHVRAARDEAVRFLRVAQRRWHKRVGQLTRERVAFLLKKGQLPIHGLHAQKLATCPRTRSSARVSARARAHASSCMGVCKQARRTVHAAKRSRHHIVRGEVLALDAKHVLVHFVQRVVTCSLARAAFGAHRQHHQLARMQHGEQRVRDRPAARHVHTAARARATPEQRLSGLAAGQRPRATRTKRNGLPALAGWAAQASAPASGPPPGSQPDVDSTRAARPGTTQ